MQWASSWYFHTCPQCTSIIFTPLLSPTPTYLHPLLSLLPLNFHVPVPQPQWVALSVAPRSMGKGMFPVIRTPARWVHHRKTISVLATVNYRSPGRGWDPVNPLLSWQTQSCADLRWFFPVTVSPRVIQSRHCLEDSLPQLHLILWLAPYRD